MKHIERLRKMVTMAFHMEWIERDLFVKFKMELVKEELEKIDNFSTSFGKT